MVFRKDRNAFGGGVFQGFKSDLAYIEEADFGDNKCEILWSSLKIANRKTFYVSSFCRPPNSSIEILDHLGYSIKMFLPKFPIILMSSLAKISI